MKVGRQQLETILLNNVAEVRFARKRPVKGKPATRRMLCTKSYNLLNSANGKIILNYQAPTKPAKINESKDNLLIVWDILMQDYRCINMNSCEVIQQMPADDKFWEYFNKNIYPMSANNKQAFMDS